MTQIDIKTSKHNGYACYASSASLAAARTKAIEQAWASIEAELVDKVVVELTTGMGKIDNLEGFLAVCYKPVCYKHLRKIDIRM